MINVIELKDGAQITSWCGSKIKIKSYCFTYITEVNGIKNEVTYDIYFDQENNKFFASSFMSNTLYFETFNDCRTYIFDCINKLKARLDYEQDQIRAYKSTKRRGRPKKKEAHK